MTNSIIAEHKQDNDTKRHQTFNYPLRLIVSHSDLDCSLQQETQIVKENVKTPNFSQFVTLHATTVFVNVFFAMKTISRETELAFSDTLT